MFEYIWTYLITLEQFNKVEHKWTGFEQGRTNVNTFEHIWKLDSTKWYCMVLHGFAIHHMVLHVIACYCTVIHYIANFSPFFMMPKNMKGPKSEKLEVEKARSRKS